MFSVRLNRFLRASVIGLVALLRIIPSLSPVPVVFASCSVMLAVAPVGAATVDAKRSYDLPRGDAATTLRQFAAASGRSLVFVNDKVRGEITNAVRGDFAPQDALKRMLAGSALEAAQDAATGALVVSRKSSAEAAPRPGEVGPVSDPQPKPNTNSMKPPLTRRAVALFAGWLAAIASADAQTAATTAASGETVKLSPFEVVAESEPGYRAANSVTASRFALPIIDTPMSIAVVTEEFLKDIGARDALDSLSYVSGVTQAFSPVRLEGSNGFNIRGVQTSFMLRNGVTSYGINDGYNIERWEVLKGIVGIRRFRVRKADGSEEMTTYGIHGYNWKKRLTGSNICSVTFSIEAVEAVVDGLGIIQTF